MSSVSLDINTDTRLRFAVEEDVPLILEWTTYRVTGGTLRSLAKSL